MAGDMRLERPSADLRGEYLAFYQDWVASGERMVPWVIRTDPSDFDGMLRFLRDNEGIVGGGGVPSSTYWLVAADGRVVGVSNLRHHLNERLLRLGGHIGYGIRPSDRHKGYATRLLALTLAEAKMRGLTRVLLCCAEGNVASEKTIRKNAGTPDHPGVDDDGETVLRFWVALG